MERKVDEISFLHDSFHRMIPSISIHFREWWHYTCWEMEGRLLVVTVTVPDPIPHPVFNSSTSADGLMLDGCFHHVTVASKWLTRASWVFIETLFESTSTTPMSMSDPDWCKLHYRLSLMNYSTRTSDAGKMWMCSLQQLLAGERSVLY